jgi:hypothetical protein
MGRSYSDERAMGGGPAFALKKKPSPLGSQIRVDCATILSLSYATNSQSCAGAHPLASAELLEENDAE